MRITMAALGTRGDVQPALAFALGLRAAGHDVTIIAGDNFRAWVEGHGFAFRACADMEELMKSPEGVAWVEEPNPLKQLTHMKNLLAEYGDGMTRPIAEAAAETDVYISGFVSAPFVDSAVEGQPARHIVAALQPFRPTRSGAASLNPIVPRGESLLNWLAGKLGERLIWNVSAEAVNRMRMQTLGLPSLTRQEAMRRLAATPIVYGFSPHVIPRPNDWSAHERIAGYWFLDESSGYQPPEALQRFLEAGDAPVYVGFGSMSSSDPGATLQLIVRALEQVGRRAIVGAGWSGANAAALPDTIYLLDGAPHAWLFERVAAVVHHGGAGTTGAGLRAGAPTMIVPHMSDQPFWGRRVYELGVGVKPIPRHKLTAEALAAGLRTLTTDEGLRARARALGEAIRAEDGVAAAVRMIETDLKE